MDVQRGMRDKLSKYVDISKTIEVLLKIDGTSEYDFCCFGVDANEKLSDDRYMIFYNQLSSPNGEIVYSQQNKGALFRINVNSIPNTISKLVFTISIDGNGTMGDIRFHDFSMGNIGSCAVSGRFYGGDFHSEKAVISIEFYRKGEWRFAVVENGFDGGIKDLLHHFGGVEEEEVNPAPIKTVQTPPVPSAPPKVSLEKKLKSAPELVSLAKPIMVQLEKKNLTDCVARVALVMDISGSMWESYNNGTVQKIVNKILPLAVQFDDDGELDFWYYGSICERCDSVNLGNYKKAVPRNWEKLMKKLKYGNNEPVVMQSVIDEYRGTKLPAYVIFVTDGGVSYTDKIKSILRDSSKIPIFWQFVGVSGSGYGILEELDNLGGRYVDNANFFALDDFRSVSNEELYSRLLNEFPIWLKEIKRLGMIR